MANRSPIQQPKFDNRIYSLVYPLMGGRAPGQGVLKRGFMIWDKPIAGFNGRATVHFLYNPSTVEADYSMSDASVGASLLFPNPNDAADLRVPLSQTVNFSILYDRTYELWGQYNPNGTAKNSIGKDKNNPQVIGVLADIFQMQQFTGMTVGYYTQGGVSTQLSDQSFTGHQGILQLIPSYIYFGDSQNLSFYGYIDEWDFQITHWNQFMVPMRCVIDISFTMLPPPKNTTKPGPGSNSNSSWNNFNRQVQPPGPSQQNGISGR